MPPKRISVSNEWIAIHNVASARLAIINASVHQRDVLLYDPPVRRVEDRETERFAVDDVLKLKVFVTGKKHVKAIC